MTTKYFGGIDLGATTTLAVVKCVDDGPLVIHNVYQISLSVGSKNDKAAEICRRLLKLTRFIKSCVNDLPMIRTVLIEEPPMVRNVAVYAGLCRYLGATIAALGSCGTVVDTDMMTVGQWRKHIRANVKLSSKEHTVAERSELTKYAVIVRVHELTGVKYAIKDNDKADGVGIALAAAANAGVPLTENHHAKVRNTGCVPAVRR